MLPALVDLDLRAFWLINGHHNAFFDAFFQAVTWLGSGWVAIPATLLAVAFFKRRARETSLAALCFLATGLLTPLAQGILQRSRPPAYFEIHDARGNPGSAPVHLLGFSHKSGSFPSRHANTAFTAAAVLFFLLGARFWPALIAAALVAYSRSYLGVHFPSDTVGGALLGVGCVWLVLLGFGGGGLLSPAGP